MCICVRARLQRDGSLLASICAHSRWLSCMDIHPTKDLVASGAEDGTIAVWTLPMGAQKVRRNECGSGVRFLVHVKSS